MAAVNLAAFYISRHLTGEMSVIVVKLPAMLKSQVIASLNSMVLINLDRK